MPYGSSGVQPPAVPFSPFAPGVAADAAALVPAAQANLLSFLALIYATGPQQLKEQASALVSQFAVGLPTEVVQSAALAANVGSGAGAAGLVVVKSEVPSSPASTVLYSPGTPQPAAPGGGGLVLSPAKSTPTPGGKS